MRTMAAMKHPVSDDDDKNSASNKDNQNKSTPSEQESVVLTERKGDNTMDTSLVTEKPINEDNSNPNSSEKATTKSTEREFDTAAITTDSSAKDQAADNNIPSVLLANPNISVRELFPGEEDLGLQFEIPFGASGSQRTPEGWTRVQTLLQYDKPTQRLWEELQKPYGNQSSFLRHLILLEKFFRNGDLILSASVSNNDQDEEEPKNKDDDKNASIIAGSKTSTAATTSKEIDPNTPTFVIDNDDGEKEEGGKTENADVELTSIEKLPKLSAATSPSVAHSHTMQQNKQQLQLSRSLSVDKVTKQLSTVSVATREQSKGPFLGATNSKRAAPSPQKSLLEDNLMHQSNNSASTTTNTGNLAVANAAPSLTNTPASIQPPLPPLPPVAEAKQQKILEVANKLLGNQLETAANIRNKNQASLLSSPPPLVSLRQTTMPLLPNSTGNAVNTASSSTYVASNTSRLSSNFADTNQLPLDGGGATDGGGDDISVSSYANSPKLFQLLTKPKNLKLQQQQYSEQRHHSAPALYYNWKLAPKTPATNNITSTQSLPASNSMMPLLPNSTGNAVNTASSSTYVSSNTSRLSSNFADTNQLSLDGGGDDVSVSSYANSPKLFQLLTKPINPKLQQQQYSEQRHHSAPALHYNWILAPKTPATSNITSTHSLSARNPMMPLLPNSTENAVDTVSSSSPDGSNTKAKSPNPFQLLTKSNNPPTTLTSSSNAAKLQQQQDQQQQQKCLPSNIRKPLTVVPQHKLNTKTGSCGGGQTTGRQMKK